MRQPHDVGVDEIDIDDVDEIIAMEQIDDSFDDEIRRDMFGNVIPYVNPKSKKSKRLSQKDKIDHFGSQYYERKLKKASEEMRRWSFAGRKEDVLRTFKEDKIVMELLGLSYSAFLKIIEHITNQKDTEHDIGTLGAMNDFLDKDKFFAYEHEYIVVGEKMQVFYEPTLALIEKYHFFGGKDFFRSCDRLDPLYTVLNNWWAFSKHIKLSKDEVEALYEEQKELDSLRDDLSKEEYNRLFEEI